MKGAKVRHGKVKFFHYAEKYGFIKFQMRKNLMIDVFFDAEDMDPGYDTPYPNDPVQFTIAPGSWNRVRARNVTPVMN